MTKKVELNICLGSSCFARGNKTIVHDIQLYIEEHQLQEKVTLKGSHCFGHCAKGPVIKVNEEIYEYVNFLNIIDIITKEIAKLDR